VCVILSHLDYSTLQAARLVCRAWYQASLAPEILCKEQLVLGYDNFTIEEEENGKTEIEKLQIDPS